MSLTTDMTNPALSPEAVAAREMLRMMVARTIFCPFTGRMLTNDTAVLIEGTRANGEAVRPFIVHPAALTPEVEADICGSLAALGATVRITRGAS